MTATTLPVAARHAARSIADSSHRLDTDADVALALCDLGYRPSLFADLLDGIRTYALTLRAA